MTEDSRKDQYYKTELMSLFKVKCSKHPDQKEEGKQIYLNQSITFYLWY